MTDATFTTREVPWAKIGHVIDEPVSSAQAAQLGGIDFDVELRPVAFRIAGKPAVGKSAWVEVPDRRATVRVDTEQALGIVSQDYRPVQYREAFSFLDSISTKIVSAGSFRDGRQAFMVVQLPERTALDLELNGEHDPHSLYVVVRTSHDLTRAVEVAVMPLRGRCMNQLTLSSLTRTAPNRWSIRHVGDPLGKLEEAKAMLARTDAYVEQFASLAQRLAAIDVELDETDELLTSILPDRPKRAAQIEAIKSAFVSAPEVGFTGTGWGLVNAVSEYFEWQRDSRIRTDRSRFLSGLDGATHKYVNRTAQLLLRR